MDSYQRILNSALVLYREAAACDDPVDNRRQTVQLLLLGAWTYDFFRFCVNSIERGVARPTVQSHGKILRLLFVVAVEYFQYPAVKHGPLFDVRWTMTVACTIMALLSLILIPVVLRPTFVRSFCQTGPISEEYYKFCGGVVALRVPRIFHTRTIFRIPAVFGSQCKSSVGLDHPRQTRLLEVIAI
jgi:hypothetical protein